MKVQKLRANPYTTPMQLPKLIHFVVFKRSEICRFFGKNFMILCCTIFSERCPNLSQIVPQGEEEHIIPMKTTVEIKASLTVDNFHSHLNEKFEFECFSVTQEWFGDYLRAGAIIDKIISSIASAIQAIPVKIDKLN